MRTIIASSALATALLHTGFAAAQPPSFIELGASESYRFAALQGSSNYRVGNAILVRLAAIAKKDGVSFSPLVLAACDKSWITTAIQTAYKFDKATFEELLTYGKESEESLPLDAVAFQSTEETQLLIAQPLFRRVPELCKAAGKEPRNILVPVAETTKKDDTGTSIAIVLGTASKTGLSVDTWSRTTYFRLVPILNKDGQPWEYNGEIQKKKEVTGKYSMERSAYNCKEKSMGTYESAEYDEQGSTPKSSSLPRDKLAFSSVIPGSIGEAKLDAVCALYGSK
jgi:hypothetical protein